MYTIARREDEIVLFNGINTHLAACLGVKMSRDVETGGWVAECESVLLSGQGETPEAARDHLKQVLRSFFVRLIKSDQAATALRYRCDWEKASVSDEIARDTISKWSDVDCKEFVFLSLQRVQSPGV